MGCTLAAQHHRDHPLATLAAREPAALEFIADLGRLRNDASHDTPSLPTVAIATEAWDRLFALLRALVGTGPVEADAAADADLGWGADLVLRMRAQAEHAVQAYPGIDEFLELRTRLIDLHLTALWVRMLDRSGATAEGSLKTRLRDFAVAASIVVEALLAEVERVAPSLPDAADAVSDDRAANAHRIAAAATAVGFALDADGALPAALTHARATRIRRAAQGQAETLSARLIAQLLSADRQPDHPLRGAAGQAPELLLGISRVVEARGHGDEVSITAADASELEKVVADVVRAVLAALD